MHRIFLAIAGFAGATGVALGALGAHALAARLGESLSTWQTAVEYHLVHALALLVLAFHDEIGNTPRAVAGWLFVVGIICFSGSLYLLALGGPGALGPVTPIGGVAFIGGWITLVVAALARRP
jgi:uncharacterized membrane protein YgdD (TMEM256/DUF423 family)